MIHSFTNSILYPLYVTINIVLFIPFFTNSQTREYGEITDAHKIKFPLMQYTNNDYRTNRSLLIIGPFVLFFCGKLSWFFFFFGWRFVFCILPMFSPNNRWKKKYILPKRCRLCFKLFYFDHWHQKTFQRK